MTFIRPMPPAHLVSENFDDVGLEPRFEPADDVADWITNTFLNESSPLYNPEHDHLKQASIGVLWTDADNRSRGQQVAGTCEIFQPKGNRWQIARQKQQVYDWFGQIPDFLITLSATHAVEMNDATFCALVEHEIFHAAQDYKDGMPRFSKSTGLPLWTLRGHDIEQFTGIVRRYGQDAAGVRHMVEAARQHQLEPIFDDEAVAFVCGSCSRV